MVDSSVFYSIELSTYYIWNRVMRQKWYITIAIMVVLEKILCYDMDIKAMEE